MSKTAAEKREDKRGSIGQKNVDNVPLGITATEALMDLTPSLTEESLTNKCAAQSIRRGIVEEATVSLPAV